MLVAVAVSGIGLMMATPAVETPTAASNLNGANYLIANMPQLGNSTSLRARSALYFDVYTEVIASLYSEVQWSTHPVPFPADFVKQFDGTQTFTTTQTGCIILHNRDRKYTITKKKSSVSNSIGCMLHATTNTRTSMCTASLN